MGRPDEPLFYKIGDAAARVGVETHVLRFWTREFPQIQPSRLKGRHRLYSFEDVRLFQEIRRLLYEERFTIEGARKRLAEEPFKAATSSSAQSAPAALATPAAPADSPDPAPAESSKSTAPDPAEGKSPKPTPRGRAAKSLTDRLLPEIRRELVALRRLLAEKTARPKARGQEADSDARAD
jgi:DNA-binding transcriptional MerR regulator